MNGSGRWRFIRIGMRWRDLDGAERESRRAGDPSEPDPAPGVSLRRGALKAIFWQRRRNGVSSMTNDWLLVIGRTVVHIDIKGGCSLTAPFAAYRRLATGASLHEAELRERLRLLEEALPPGSPEVAQAEEWLAGLGEPMPPARAEEAAALLALAERFGERQESSADPMTRAQRALRRRLPFFSALLLRVQAVPVTGAGTATIDRWGRLFYDPGWLGELTVNAAMAVVYHELSHLLRLHHLRGERLGETGALWNIACDLEVNDDLPLDFPLPPGALTPARLGLESGCLAEEYFALLKERPELVPPQAGVTVGGGSCGSGAGGEPAPWETADPAQEAGRGGERWWLSTIELESIAAAAADELRNRWSGHFGSWSRWAGWPAQPSRDWRRELALAVRAVFAHASGASDYSYGRPSRRASVAGPVVLPSVVAHRSEVAIVVDTSASMSDDQLARALGEIDAILRANGRQPATVYAVDTKVKAVSRAASARQVRLAGRGGTNMVEGIRAALRSRPRPGLIILLTDGDTPWPIDAPPVPVIVGLIRRDGRPYGGIPAWARTVLVPAG